jgi:hypothetical protein
MRAVPTACNTWCQTGALPEGMLCAGLDLLRAIADAIDANLCHLSIASAVLKGKGVVTLYSKAHYLAVMRLDLGQLRVVLFWRSAL